MHQRFKSNMPKIRVHRIQSEVCALISSLPCKYCETVCMIRNIDMHGKAPEIIATESRSKFWHSKAHIQQFCLCFCHIILL